MPLRFPRRYIPLLLALILLLIAASRAFRLDATVTEVTVDEVWSVWQTFGTPKQIIEWTPYDWTPGYYLTLGAWRVLVGLHPIALRWLSLLSFVIGSAAIYRVGRRLGGSGVITMLAFAAFSYLIFMSTELRGYILLLALYPLALWLALRYFDHPRPRQAILLALIAAAMIYISLTSVAALGALVLFTLIVYRRTFWRWALPGGLTLILIAPVILTKAHIVIPRLQSTLDIALPPFLNAVIGKYEEWSSPLFPLWFVLFVLAIVLLVRWQRREIVVGLLVWAFLPAALYITNFWLGFFNVRYAWWIMPGIALLLGVGLARLPKFGQVGAAAIFAVQMMLPIPLNHYQIPQPPLGTAFTWLTEHLQPGDVMLVDPKCGCGAPEIFDYYTHVYFPGGLLYITNPDHERRIWYVTGAAGATPDMLERVSQGRAAGIFVGPPEGLFRLYEAPPNPEGILYENGMRFHGIDILDKSAVLIYHEGDPIHVRLWWSVDTPPPLDYSVGLYVVNAEGEVIAQNDSAPNVADAPTATSQWQPGQFYIDERTLQLPYPLFHGQYRLMVVVYWYGDVQPISAPGVDTNGLLPLSEFTVVSWWVH